MSRKKIVIQHVDKHPVVASELGNLKTLCARRDEALREVEELHQKPESDQYIEELLKNPDAKIVPQATGDEIKKVRLKAATLDKAAQALSVRVGELRREASKEMLGPVREQRRRDIKKLHEMLKPIIEFCQAAWVQSGELRQSGVSGLEDLRHLGPAPGNPQEWLKRWEERHKDFLE